MRTNGVLLAACLLAVVVGLSWSMSPMQTAMDAGAGQAVSVDDDDIAGVVTGPSGPEAGVWVIAETMDLPTRFSKIVVTDDQGRYLVPDLPDATYDVWVRGYSLVDSPKLRLEPGTTRNLTAVVAPDAAAAAQYYPAGYWLSLLEVPGVSDFPGTGNDGNGISPDVQSQAQWIRSVKSGGCTACHALGGKATREIPPELGEFDSMVAAWDRRIQSGQAGGSMVGGLNRMGRRRAIEMFADWTDRIVAGELPPAPERPQGIERNVVVTQWDWADEKAYLHDEISTDKRNPTVNAYGPIYGALEASADYVPVLNPVSHERGEIPVTVRDPDTPVASGPPLAPSPYWGDEAIWDSKANIHNPMLDHRGRVWLTSRVMGADTPAWCQAGSDHPSARAFPNARAGRHLAVHDPGSGETTLIATCYGTHHLVFAEDDDHTIWTSGGGQVLGWLNTRMFDETGDEQASQGWTALVVDTNGNGRRDEYTEPGEPLERGKDMRIRTGYYGVAVNPVDGTIWGSSLGFPGLILRVDPGANPSETALTELFELPWGNPAGRGPGLFAAWDGHRPQRRRLDAACQRPSCELRSPHVRRAAERPRGDRPALPGGVDALRGAVAAAQGRDPVGKRGRQLLRLGRSVRHARSRNERADQHRERLGRAAGAGRRRMGRAPCAVSARFLHQVDGRADRRSRQRVERPGALGHLWYPHTVPSRDGQGDAEQGRELSAAAGSVGEVGDHPQGPRARG